MALECMSKNVTEENKNQIEKSLRLVLLPLKPWVGAMVRDNAECDDWQRSLKESMWQVCDTVLELGLYSGLSEDHRRFTEVNHSQAETHIKLHTKSALRDRLSYRAEHPWGWIGHMARHEPKRLLREVGAYFFVAPTRKILGRKDMKPEGERSNTCGSVVKADIRS